MKFFDEYSLKARVAPITIMLMPVAVNIYVWTPETYRSITGISSAVVLVALSILGSSFGRHYGKTKEQELWRSWGGPPTTQLLRHNNSDVNPIQRERYHRLIKRLMPEVVIPTKEQEAADVVAADQIYESCISFLISNTRDTKKFGLLFQENINYGFLRNLWGLKKFGICTTLLGICSSGVFTYYKYVFQGIISEFGIMDILLCVFLFVLWITWVKPSTIRVAANAYGGRLLECSEQLNSKI